MISGDFAAAEAAFRMPLPPGNSHSDWYYSSLGWCLLAQGKKAEASRAFEQALFPLPHEGHTFDFSSADHDQLTAAYFLDLITESQFVDRAGATYGKQSHCWFYIGQRREIEKKPVEAIQAYERCIALMPKGKPPHIAKAYARWRLIKLRGGSPEEAVNAAR